MRIQNVDPDMADALGLDEAKGALVTDVPEGPALTAGHQVRRRDPAASATRRSTTPASWCASSPTPPVGETVDVVVFRDGKEETLQVEIGLLEEPTLAAAPGGAAPTRPRPSAPRSAARHDAVAVVTDDLRRASPSTRDATRPGRDRLDESSDAYAKGMREGDVIAEVGQEAVANPEGDARAASRPPRQAGRNSILLLVRREGQPRFVALNLTG